MSLSSTRPYTNSAPQPYSPAITTASSLNYSSYGAGGSNGMSASLPPNGGAPRLPPMGRSVSGGANGGASLGPGSTGMQGGMSKSASGGSGNGGLGGANRAETREVARSHWRALREFLASWLKEETPSARASAREKLTRLTKLQFQELSTDVYDELMRRLAADGASPDQAVPFLPVREDFHPKRNQARQKLATLPKNRFKDLASDVFYELKRRYPEFEETPEESYDPPPAPGPVPSRQGASSSQSYDRPIPSRLNSTSSHQRQGSRQLSASSQGTHRSRPSISRRDDEIETLHPNGYRMGNGNSPGPGINPLGTTNDIVIPNKSRLREEEIEVPYARDSVLEPSPSVRTGSRASRRDSQLSGTSISRVAPNAPPDVLSPALTDDPRQYYDRMSFSSNVTSKSRPRAPGGDGDDEKEQKLRQEYEFKIAGLERRVALAESERDEARKGSSRRTEWEEEVRGLKERATIHASSLRSVQHELDLQRDATDVARRQGEESVRAAEEEMAQWRERAEALEDETRRLDEENRALKEGGDDAGMAELRNELHTLVDELNALSTRNDELMAEREQDAAGMNEMEARVEEYRKKYEAVRIELRNLKATSIMFVPKPLSDDHLPASADGNIADVHVSAFQSAIDGLLAAARSSHPTGVLSAMKAVVESVTDIGEDVKAFEAKPNLDVDASRLESLKHESTTRLSQLMQAARNHAMASGLSPISLLDGAAGHLSTNVVEIIKLLKIRRSVRRSRSSLSIRDMVGREARSGSAASAASATTATATAPSGSRDVREANGNWDREYGVPGVGAAEMMRSESSLSRNDGRSRATPSPALSPMGNAQPGFNRSVSDSRATPSPAPTLAHTASYSYGQNQSSSAAKPTPISTNGINSRQMSTSPVPNRMGSPGMGFMNGHTNALSPTLRDLTPSSRPELRINSYQSASSQARSDAFDLERKASVISNGGGYFGSAPGGGAQRAPLVEARVNGLHGDAGGYRSPVYPDESGQGLGQAQAQGQGQGRQASPLSPRLANRSSSPEKDEGLGYTPGVGTEEEWEELKPYLNTQSSALVNSIQNLLAAIRTNQQTPALNEHLSEVIAIASSIVAVAGNALPEAYKREGEVLLRELVSNTNKLSEAQESARSGQGQGGFGKETRQGIASASFGVAKGLKSLMKLGAE